MDENVLLAIIFKRVEERLQGLSHPPRGPRGQRGPRGSDGKDGKDFRIEEHLDTIRETAKAAATVRVADLSAEEIELIRGPRGREGRAGKDFSFEEHREAITALVQEYSLKFSDLTEEQIEQLRGRRGEKGEAGKDFVYEEHEEKIRSLVKEFSLKFSDLTEEEREEIRGPRGREGKPGKSFSFDENREEIAELVQNFITSIQDSLKLRFEDLSQEDLDQIRGPRGRDGKPGKDFSFEENEERIASIVQDTVKGAQDSLKLKFSDLTDEDREELRGRPGRDGKPGKSFSFDEHKEYFDSLKPKFSDFSAEEVAQLMLKFSHLTEEEKNSLKLRFEDLTEEDRRALKGARGPRGQRGKDGERGQDGKTGLQGPRGKPGVQGVMGLQGKPGLDGRDGRDGRDGVDAPYIVEIRIDQYRKDEFEFIFDFSDGTSLRSNPVKLPRGGGAIFFGGGGGGGGGGADVTTRYQGYSNRFDEFFDTTGTEQTLLQILDFGYAAPAITIAGSVSTALREKGTVVASNTITAMTMKRSEDITRVEFYKNGVLAYTENSPNPAGGSEVWVDSAGFDDTASYQAIAYDTTGSTNSNTLNYGYVYPYYYGVGAPALSAADVALLTKDIIGNTATVARQFSPTAQVYYFAYPASYAALSSILDTNGFETIGDWTLRTENITGLDGNAVSYRIYEFNNLTTQTAFTNTFKQ